jgi:hypothetical protein
MMKCLEVRVGVTEPSYHSAIRCNSNSQSCYAAENRAHRPGSYWIALRAFSRIAFLERVSVSRCCRQTGDNTSQSHKLMRLPVSDES